MAPSFASSVADSSHHVRLYEKIIYYTIIDEVCVRSNLRIIKRTFVCRPFPFYVDILLLLHGSRAVHGLVHVATAIQYSTGAGQLRCESALSTKNRGSVAG